MDSTAGHDWAEHGEEQPKRHSRLRRISGFIFPGFVVLGLVAWGWDATHHDHEGGHGAPATAAEMQVEMVDGPFSDGAGGTVTVTRASCYGDGEQAAAGYTHFDCQLAFDDGSSDEVIVHLLANGEIFFVSSAGG